MEQDSGIQPGDVLRGRYEINRLLRAACDKKVYLAHDLELDRPVALDVFSNNSIMPSGLTVSAWEARVLAKLDDHPNIATVVDRWEDNEMAVMVTRYLSGGNLLDRIARAYESGTSLPVKNILRYSIEIARGLSYIHRRGILYRDLQPRNVLFDERSMVHLVDFDTAVSLQEHGMSDLSHRPVINYMAPELTDGKDTDERADLYSLGATIYEMCCGSPPFTGSHKDVLAARRAGPPPPLDRGDLPGALSDLVFWLLAYEREQRPDSAADVVHYLEDIRKAHADRERLLALNIDGGLLDALAAFLNNEYRPSIGRPQRNTGFNPTLMKPRPRISLPPDHYLLIAAIRALAEANYRQASIDAAAAAETAIRWALSHLSGKGGVNSMSIEQELRGTKGLFELISLYSSLGRNLPVSSRKVVDNLARVRNNAAHSGQTPSPNEAARAVRIAHDLVRAVHPFSWPARPSRPSLT